VDPFARRARRQLGLVARWQLLDDGVPSWTIDWYASTLRSVFPGVYVTGWAPVTAEQRRWAATLTAPWTVLSHEAAFLAWGFAERLDGRPTITVTRPGTCGIEQHRDLRVHYSTMLHGHVRRVDGFRITTPERTLIDCWGRLPRWRWKKGMREALRRELTSIPAMLRALRAHPGRRGVARIRRILRAWSALPFHRCKSDAEAYALTLFAERGFPIPLVNTVVAGEEADFFWPDRRWVLELDGPQWHRFKEVDARKTAAWVADGNTVRRLETDTLFADASSLFALTPP